MLTRKEPEKTQSVYSHKREYGDNGCGDQELTRQDQIHLKKKKIFTFFIL